MKRLIGYLGRTWWFWALVLFVILNRTLNAQTCLIVPRNAGYFPVLPIRPQPAPPCDSLCLAQRKAACQRQTKDMKQFGIILLYVAIVFFTILGSAKLLRLFIVVFLFVPSISHAQTCDSPPRLLRKGETLVANCDSLVLIPAGRLRLALNFERNKNAALVRINTDKDKAVKALVTTYENRIANLQKQVETLETSYEVAIDTARRALYDARISTEQIKGTVTLLQYQIKSAVDVAEMERYAAKRLLLKRSLIWGSVGVGIGAIFTTILFLGI